ncbi:MAG: hypothetical protein ACD_59C00110G0001 [uncultured bacterium]|nr:MAG: hypothetical protein ACD_59C00110G0001 [uncultured bacterium]
MSYFSDNYNEIRYPIEDNDSSSGLRRAQIGAIHSIASHFSLINEPAIVVMPTGSGKTAVLMMSAFVERANRILVITPSRLVRTQIKENFQTMKQLIKLKVLRENINLPKVSEIVKKPKNVEEWENFRHFDVIIGTPNSLSPGLKNMPSPPKDLFDLILIDEAHHSPAKTWNDILETFNNAKQILFTATPFRRDHQEIKGRFIYSYSIKEAYKDNIFSKVKYISVNPINESNDIAIAKTAATIFNEDRIKGFNHYLMVRTDSKKRAEELEIVYNKNTNLRLKRVDSSYSYRYVKNAIEKLRKYELDGIICVDMLGEGFDFPNLKLASIHAPHKSLEVTLQFIGRFARTTGENLGMAKFIAVPSELEIETKRLYEEGAVWQDLITDLSQSKIEKEKKVRQTLATFDPPNITKNFVVEDLSLYALYPYCHVKIFQSFKNVDITAPISLPGIEIVYRQNSLKAGTSVIITREPQAPRWSSAIELTGFKHELIVIFYDNTSKLLFINSSKTSDSLYDIIAAKLTDDEYKILPLYKINRVLRDLQEANFFNIGMKNRVLNDNTESYRIIAGSSAQDAINVSDGNLYNRGHVFSSAIDNGDKTTLGYSSASKVWSNNSCQIPELIEWCQKLARKITSKNTVTTNSGLDIIKVGEEIINFPKDLGIIAVDWSEEIYNKVSPPMIIFGSNSKNPISDQLFNVELKIDRNYSNQKQVRIIFKLKDLEYLVEFSLNTKHFYTAVSEANSVIVKNSKDEFSLVEYLNNNPLNIYLSDFSRINGSEIFKTDSNELKDIDPNIITAIDWSNYGVDITNEVSSNPTYLQISIHDYFKEKFRNENHSVVIYDHRSGEIADFIIINELNDNIKISLYHCKGSSDKSPGNRVEDVYEICGQTVKSRIWIKSKGELFEKIRKRISAGSELIKGNFKILSDIQNHMATKQVNYEIILVQPGITKSGLSKSVSSILASAHDYIKRVHGEKFSIIASF